MEREAKSRALRSIALALERAEAEILERCRSSKSRDLEPAALAARLYAESKRVAATDPERASELADLASRIERGVKEGES